MTPTQTAQEIREVIATVIRAGLSNEQRYPGTRSSGANEVEIYIEGSPDLSISLRALPYADIYSSLHSGGAFNLRMIDGSLIQMTYTFKRNKITGHRLGIFPAPNLEPYEDAQEFYDVDELFAEYAAPNVVRFPLRFDFSSDEHIDIEHPKSHLTLGQYKNCRIPVSAPLTPRRFIRFILRSFYYPAMPRVEMPSPDTDRRFEDTITTGERAIAFFSA